MKNVLLPTDLTVQSLAPVHTIVRDAENEKVSIRLVHLISLPTSISELLFLEENKPYNQVPDNFIEAFQMLHNKYKKSIEKLDFHFVYCNTSRYLNNYLEGNGINAVYMLTNYSYQQPLRQSQKFATFIQHCKVPLIKLSLQTEVQSEYHILSSLLSNNDRKPITSVNSAKTTNSYS